MLSNAKQPAYPTMVDGDIYAGLTKEEFGALQLIAHLAMNKDFQPSIKKEDVTPLSGGDGDIHYIKKTDSYFKAGLGSGDFKLKDSATWEFRAARDAVAMTKAILANVSK